ncbi:MAG TPA: helix-turn-helix domain-containing protein, partial [Opitutus sp.]|nr:helix-turn-helix domain-containing protein [Opitutus sp.]
MRVQSDRYSDTMETASTVLKALDLLTILSGRADGLPLPELAQALNQPRTNVVRLLRTLELYGLVAPAARRWRTTEAFRTWPATPDRHQALRRRYRPVLDAVAARTGELVLLGVHEGNGIVHIDY